MNLQAHSESGQFAQDSEPGDGPAEMAAEQNAAPETSQAERAAMHPDQYDLEWRYYCHAWSN